MPPPTEYPAADGVPSSPRVLRSASWPVWWPWAVGFLVGLVVLGPGLSGGSLLSLDLLVTPHIPIPNGVFGLGPALSQRVPLFAVLGLGSMVVGGPVATKAFIVVCAASAFAGAARLARRLGPPDVVVGAAGQVAAGLLWAAGPYALTRTAVGHINLLWAIAVLPWALPRLCRPAQHLPSTFLASLAMAVGGPGGGTLGIAIAVLSLLLQPRPRRWARPAVAIGVPHLVWVAPTAVLLWAGAGVTGAGGFATTAKGVFGWPAVAAGGGFWRGDFQIGAHGAVGALCGLVLLGLAAVGGRRSVRFHGVASWQGAAAVVAGVGLALAVASAVPGVRSVYGWLSDLPLGAPLRESQRFLALWLVWACPVASVGAASLAASLASRRAPSTGSAEPELSAPGVVARSRPVAVLVAALPVLLAVVMTAPGWWGVQGHLDPVQYPAGWALARAEIARHPGTVVALPWDEYPVLAFAGGRQAFNPVPDYLGGDVISSYDPLFDRSRPSQEQVDRRAVEVDALARRIRAGQPVSAALADLGVRWVVLVHEDGHERYAALADDLGLRRALSLPDVDLYEVTGWTGRAVGPDGAGYGLRRPIPPLIRTSAPAGSVLDVSGAPGWLQGWSAVRVTDDGRLQLPGGSRTVWFWPAPVLVVLDLGLAVAAIWCIRSRRQEFGRILAPRGARG